MLLAYIHRSITHRVHFLDKASRDLFICAKYLFVEATQVASAEGDGGTPIASGGSKRLLAKLEFV
jgi:hypothetical protein